MKRWCFLVHRWLGIGLCLLMALWFLSGVVMMYVGYPKLTPAEHLRVLPALATDCCPVPPGRVFALAGPTQAVQSLRLTSIGDRAVYVATLSGGRSLAVDAVSGQPLVVDAAQAGRAAAGFAPGGAVAYEGPVEEDAWTHSKALVGHRPLHRFADDRGGLLYVSSASGEVVRDVSPVERSWGWLGAWLHWVYPLRGGWAELAWRDFVIYSSLAGSLLAICGLLVGVWRWRRRPYAHGRHTPYRSAWMRWHHWLGLAGGGLALTWVLSGLFSMNPWRIFEAGAPALRVPVLQAEEFARLTPRAALQRFRAAGHPSVELVWQPLAGELYGVATDGQGGQRLLRWQADSAVVHHHPLARLRAAGEALLPDATLIDASVQDAYDWHYFARAEHTMSGHLERPLPVLRLRFDDPAATWLYLDPASGRVVQRLDSHRRVQRVLFTFLHSWDWCYLLERRPLWDVLLITASLAGFLLSVTGIVIGWRRLRR